MKLEKLQRFAVSNKERKEYSNKYKISSPKRENNNNNKKIIGRTNREIVDPISKSS